MINNKFPEDPKGYLTFGYRKKYSEYVWSWKALMFYMFINATVPVLTLVYAYQGDSLVKPLLAIAFILVVSLSFSFYLSKRKPKEPVQAFSLN